MNKFIIALVSIFLFASEIVNAADQFVSFSSDKDGMILTSKDLKNFKIYCDESDHEGVLMAMDNLRNDIFKVTGNKPDVSGEIDKSVKIIVGSLDKSSIINRLVKSGKIDAKLLKGKNEKFIITTLKSPVKGIDGDVVVIAGSDKRGTIYGIYEMSRQIGVSPWYWWADVPVEKRDTITIKRGIYTDGEPKVKYRGIFINDEWPCMGGWATEKFGGFNSKMYVHMYELLLRLKANFMWPAMWSAAFYADDPQNSVLADKMGIIIGTSHHEPMARNHQEYARNRKKYGEWNYQTNKEGVERFFREGIERIGNKEEVVTIAMRGDGDAPMGDDTDTRLLENIITAQRDIIKKITGKDPSKTPQVWALYSEVLEYFDKGMKIPDDVMVLLCDDNWGDVRRLPDLKSKRHPGGYGMYYHVDLHGAPRAYQWLNMTQIQHMWEQLYLTYSYGVDKMWILNVGDLKPNEFPTDFFLKMAWNPEKYRADNLMDYTIDFCREQFGEKESHEAARILDLYCKYASRVTAEMLDDKTYNLTSGEFKGVANEFLALEAHAVRQYNSLPEENRAAYMELILHPVQAMANLYEMYYSVAMNRYLAKDMDASANYWADRVEYCFNRDSLLSWEYNHKLMDGKWNHIMDQTHIGYRSWDEPKEGNIMPKVIRIDKPANDGGYIFNSKDGYVVMEAEHYSKALSNEKSKWTVIPGLGRTLSGISLMPYTEELKGASLTYKMKLNSTFKDVRVRVILDSTLPFIKGGHSFSISIDNDKEKVVNYNSEMTWKNCYSKMYPAGAARVIESDIMFNDVNLQEGEHTLTITPLSPAIVLHKFIIDSGKGEWGRLNLQESPYQRNIGNR